MGAKDMTKHRRGPRLVALLAAAVAVSAVALPSSAAGSFTTHFDVLRETVRVNEHPGSFTFRDVLLNPANPNNRVGWDKGRCRPARGGKLRCVIVTHLDGSIGGFGDLLLRGNIGRGDNTLNVVDGNGDFSGAVTGKVVAENPGRRVSLVHFALTR
jgi:hypothetical protein